MRFLLKLDRLAAWVLFAGLFLYFVTGLSMTKGIISPLLAYQLHLSYLTYFVLAAFVVHTSFAIRLAFKRWRIWNLAAKIILVLFYIVFVSFFIYIDKLYQRPLPAVNQVNQAAANSASQNDTPGRAVSVSEKVFSAAELAAYNGQNGQPAYAAVDGVVYNLSAVFRGGIHHGFMAGQDLTAAFYSQHDKTQLTNYPVVGILK